MEHRPTNLLIAVVAVFLLMAGGVMSADNDDGKDQAAAAAAAAAATQPETFGRHWWRPPVTPVMANGISGLWSLYQRNNPDMLGYLTFNIQGQAVTITGVFFPMGPPPDPMHHTITGAGQFVSRTSNPRLGSYGNWGGWATQYPTYKVLFGSSEYNPFLGWWTLVVVDRNNILPFKGENPSIPNPPTQSLSINEFYFK
eukprot:gene193-385_t